MLQLPSYIPGSGCFVLRLHRAFKAAGKTFKSSQKKRWETHIFERSLHSHSPCIICMPMRAHTHTQESHIPSLFPLRSCRPRPTPTPSLSPRRRSGSGSSGSVIQPASTYCSRRITQITPLAIAMVSASLSYLFKVSYDPFHSCTGFLSS